jgi:hypothetical protein
MFDEFICEGCAYSNPTFVEKCPLCGGRVVNIDDGIDNQAFAESYQDDSGAQDDMDMGFEELPRAA